MNIFVSEPNEPIIDVNVSIKDILDIINDSITDLVDLDKPIQGEILLFKYIHLIKSHKKQIIFHRLIYRNVRQF